MGDAAILPSNVHYNGVLSTARFNQMDWQTNRTIDSNGWWTHAPIICHCYYSMGKYTLRYFVSEICYSSSKKCVWHTQRNWTKKETSVKKSCSNFGFKSVAIFRVKLQFSALSSSVVDSTPVTAMMVKVLDSFAQNKSLNLPIKPIVFALAFGPTLGANGNLYGASSNILCAGVAEKLGYKMTCSQYFK